MPIQYTDPASVQEIMAKFGSMGVNNTPDGLFLRTPEGGGIVAPRGSWVSRDDDGEWVVESPGSEDGVPILPHARKGEAALYSIATWDGDAQSYTPQVGTEPCINVSWRRLLQVLRLLRRAGYSAHRFRDADGGHDDNDWRVLVERTDGKTEAKVLESWKR